ncbi:MAG: PAS domain-containing protein [Victivallales bacterium]|nr:PAS domain-containing protein [Victivallales bacterium]
MVNKWSIVNINFKQIDTLRKERGLSVTGLCSLININRTTFWAWKKKRYAPGEKNIRNLAEALNVSVTKISDLEETVTKSTSNLSESIDSWYLLGSADKEVQKREFSLINREILKLEEKLTQATTIINALLKSMPTIFYIKDKNLNYITANNSFLNNLSLSSDFNVNNKNDFDFFNRKEAAENHQQDQYVTNTGIPVENSESYIPGTRKKKWGIISKLPIFDTENRIAGIVGTFVDITDRKQAEEISKILHILLETGPGFNVSVWKDGKTLFDVSGESMLEFYSEDMKAKRNEQLDYLRNGKRHPEDVGQMDKEMDEEGIDDNIYRNPFIMTNKIYRFISSKYGTRWVKAIKSGVKIGSSLYTIGCTFLYNKEKQKESNSAAYEKLMDELSGRTNSIAWTAEFTGENQLQFTYLSKNFEEITGHSISDFINYNRKLVTLKEHFKDSHINKEKKTPFHIIEKRYHRIMNKRFFDKASNRKIKLKIKKGNGTLLNIRTSLSRQKMPGTNIIFHGIAKPV